MTREEMIERLDKVINELYMKVGTGSYNWRCELYDVKEALRKNQIPIPPAEGAEEFLKSKGYAETIKHPTDGIIAPTFTWSHVIELLQEYVIMQKPQPTAEGAEEITAKKYLSDHGYGSGTNYSSVLVAALMTEFATLHAQRLAEKMVEDELVAFLIKRDYPHAMQDECVMVMVRNIVSEYLKSRASHD